MKVVFIVIARVLATFDILPPVDENGKARMPSEEFTDDLIRYAGCHVILWYSSHGILSDVDRFFNRHPLPFECAVRPRSEKSKMFATEVLEKP